MSRCYGLSEPSSYRPSGSIPIENAVIKLGEGWIAEDLRIFHECAAGVRVELLAHRELCDCGASVPRRVRHFEEWLTNGRSILHDALLDDDAVEIEPLEPG